MEWRLCSLITRVRHRQCRTIGINSLSKRTVALSFKHLGDSSLDPEKPSIVILHGLLGNKKNWTGFAKTIVNITHRTVFTVDLRNHGFSPHANTHTYLELAEDVLELIKRQGIRKPMLIGHNMGGKTAMTLALTEPEKVSSLIVVDISPVPAHRHKHGDDVPNKIEYFKYMNAMAGVDFDKVKKVYKAKDLAKHILRPVISEENLLNRIVSNVNVKRSGSVGWICNLDVLIKNFDEISSFPESFLHKKYHEPTLFIGGQTSDFLPPDDLPAIRDMFPQCVLTYVRGAGHDVHFDDPKAFLELVLAFIKRH